MKQEENVKDHIEKAKEGDQKAFSFLLNRFWPDVYRFQLLRTHDENQAEDITIRSFSRAFDRIETYREEYEFKTWLITISKNIHIDLLRKEKSRMMQQLDEQEQNGIYQVPDDAPTAEDQLISEQDLNSLLKHIQKLKPHYQKVIHLRYFQEMTYDEIAKTLDEPLNNIKVKLLRARKLLADIIKKN
ncbi:RNA polymerase sigma factor [Robertkochia aurantiaca]|uniref:RNA polymerase sigma factor n=1 Tax=Robertkochia aurantiaca TaxID=2873700 RepID=UPI001CCE0F4A|nr:sigma-70 family RNA polymerase sigma factor [Robertkochia sp. 3YJGBD-33]